MQVLHATPGQTLEVLVVVEKSESNVSLATARYMLLGITNKKKTSSEVSAFKKAHLDELEWTESQFKKANAQRNGLRLAGIKAVIARALPYAIQNHLVDRLERFCWVLINGSTNDLDQSELTINQLREKIVANAFFQLKDGSTHWNIRHFKVVQKVLKQYLDGETLSRDFTPCEEDLFPLV
jgi:hypothetical protein